MATNYINNLTGLFADTYNCGAYGAGNFNENTCSTTGDSSITAPSTGVFGVEAVGGAGLGLALIITAVIILKSRKKKAAK
ncbi:MAG TPA: hypothetical protein PKC31_02285 [Candidatus Nanoperiomorbaceae bacterium]|jgi:LPXTG-motif cell wall-anchored protein|nr:MAG: hypothetical protein IPL44_01905 [Candidatus Saccharibacteria bacterium]HMQ09331.1 hypothetical protein [Candidatus Nanoperiomorbaceae bacterium]HMQ96760.1 hypothetical protein [Candidatus Nanoperiomorbaceae bacterium]HMR86271.1 hypothetical protein [Candidatus Nanoperiomorbaceae bacterium]